MPMNVLYLSEGTTTGVPVDSIIPLGELERKAGTAICYRGSKIFLNSVGYYMVDASFVIGTTGAGTYTIQAYEDGVAIPGALATVTVAGTGISTTVTIPFIIRNRMCCAPKEITFKLLGMTADINNTSIVVERL